MSDSDGYAFPWRSRLLTELLLSLRPVRRCEMQGIMSVKRMVSMLAGEHALLTCTVRQVHLDRAAMGDQHDMSNPPAEVCFNAT